MEKHIEALKRAKNSLDAGATLRYCIADFARTLSGISPERYRNVRFSLEEPDGTLRQYSNPAVSGEGDGITVTLECLNPASGRKTVRNIRYDRALAVEAVTDITAFVETGRYKEKKDAAERELRRRVVSVLDAARTRKNARPR